MAIANNEVISCDSVKVDKIFDLTGAGDLFAAGFLKEYLDLFIDRFYLIQNKNQS